MTYIVRPSVHMRTLETDPLPLWTSTCRQHEKHITLLKHLVQARAPAGRCKVVHLHSSEFCFSGFSRTLWDVMAHWLRRLLSTGGSWVRLPLWPSRRDLGQVLYLQLPVRLGVKLRYSIRAVVGSASEW